MPIGRADAGGQHVDARLDRHRPRVGDAGELAAPASISAISLSVVMPGRHSVLGLRLITVSNISSGAGSVAVRARPALPNTDSTSGKDLMMRSCCLQQLARPWVTDMPGSEAGMYSSVPSLSVGMNSLPSGAPATRWRQRHHASSSVTSLVPRSTTAITGR
jgi:hypothetical protein